MFTLTDGDPSEQRTIAPLEQNGRMPTRKIQRGNRHDANVVVVVQGRRLSPPAKYDTDTWRMPFLADAV